MSLKTLTFLLSLPASYPMLMLWVKMWFPNLWRSPNLIGIRRVYTLLKWVVLPFAVLASITDTYTPGKVWWGIVAAGWVLICLDDDEEDWWRKQARKASGWVKDLGHRLTVSATSAPA